MKKTTKLLCILMAFVLLSSYLAVGASAYQAYNTPSGYNSIGKPTYTYEQTCSMILDFIDVKLADANINEEVDAKVTKIRLNLTSIDKTYQSLTDLLNNGWLAVGNFFSIFGDVKNLDGDAIEDPRRSKDSDQTVFYALLEFLKDNKNPVAKVVNDTFDWGLIDNFVDEDKLPYLMRTAAWLKATLIKVLHNSFVAVNASDKIEGTTADPISGNTWGYSLSGTTLDDMIACVLERLLIGLKKTETINGEQVETYTGFLPSLKAKYFPGTQGTTGVPTSWRKILNTEAYEIILDVVSAVMKDILLPKLKEKMPDWLNITTSKDFPDGDPEAPGLLPTVIGIVNDYLHLGFDYNTERAPLLELDKFLNWLLVDGTQAGDTEEQPAAIYQIISLNGYTDQYGQHHDGLHINDELYGNIQTLLRSLGPGLLQQFLPEYFPEDMVFPDLTHYTTDQLISYLFTLLAPIYLPNVRILNSYPGEHGANGCDTVQECLTYFFISMIIDILPEHDYYGQIASGELDPQNGAWIEIGNDYLIYFLNSILPCNLPQFENGHDVTFEETTGKLARWALNEYGFIFNTRQDLASMNTWQLIDSTAFQIIDPNCLTIEVPNGATVSSTLINNVLIGGLQNFDIQKIISFIGISSNPNAELHLPLVKFVLSFLSRIFKSMMNGKDIVPSVTTIEDLVYTNSGANLGTLISNLFAALYDEREYNFPTLIPLVGQIIGLRSDASFKVAPPDDYANKSASDLRNLMNACVPPNTNLNYSDAAYGTIAEEDYKHLYMYKDFEDEYEAGQELLTRYEKNPATVTAQELKTCYYCLEYYYNLMQQSSNVRSTLCKTQLQREIEYAENNVEDENLVPGSDTGAKLYSDRSWRLYQEAKTFAEAVYNAGNVKQSKISLARQQLFAAIANLSPWVRLARYVVLDAKIAQAQAIPEEDYKLYTTSTIAEFKDALQAAVTLDRDYDVNSQSIVDACATRLNLAINGLTVWKINYELNADVIIDDVVAKDSNTVLKFREASGAAVTNVTATVNNGATIGEPYMEGDYYCWVVTPTNSQLYTVITADINFTQPSTGRSYTAKAYTFVSEGAYSAKINVNTCHIGSVRNIYDVTLVGIGEASATVTAYNADHTNGGEAGAMASIPTGTVYADVSQISKIEDIPGLMFTVNKNASSYSSANIPSGTATEFKINNIASSNPVIALSSTSSSFNLNQTDSKNITFTTGVSQRDKDGNPIAYYDSIPDPGQTIETTITLDVSMKTSTGGNDLSHPRFVLRIYGYDKSALRTTVNKAITACRQEWFYSGGWDIYMRDLENAVGVLNNPVSTQAAIDEANDNLNEAITWLEYKSADFKRLHELYCVAEALNPSDYEDFSAVARILNTINYSQGMLQQSLVDETCDNLRAAIDNLKPAQSTIRIRCVDVSNVTPEAGDETVTGNDAVGETLSVDTIYAEIGKKMIIEVPEIIGYTCEQAKQEVTVTREGVEVVFNYTPNVYRVIFNANGGTVNPTTAYVTYGKTYSDLPVPVREGYIFAGWYNKLTGGMVIDETTKVNTSYYRTLYAHWDEDPNYQNDSADAAEIIDSVDNLLNNKTVKSFINTLISFMNKIVNFVLLRVLGISK